MKTETQIDDAPCHFFMEMFTARHQENTTFQFRILLISGKLLAI